MESIISKFNGIQRNSVSKPNKDGISNYLIASAKAIHTINQVKRGSHQDVKSNIFKMVRFNCSTNCQSLNLYFAEETLINCTLLKKLRSKENLDHVIKLFGILHQSNPCCDIEIQLILKKIKAVYITLIVITS